MTEPQEARSPIAPPWFITMDGEQPRVRWVAVLTRFLLLAGAQVLICVAMAYWSKGRIGAARVGLIVLPLAVMTIFVVWRAYRLALPDAPGLIRGQLSLLALLGVMTAVCVWLAMVRFDRQSDLRWRADRARLRNEVAEIVGEGRVRWSGNQPELMVQVERSGFDDQDLQDVLRAMRRQVTWRGEGIHFLDLSETSVTDEGLALLSDCHRLRYLFLDQCAITDEGIRAVEDLSNLQVLSVRGTRVTQASLDRIRTGRPELSLEPRRVPTEN